MEKFVELPELCGRCPWYELSRYKEHKFRTSGDLDESYDFIVVGAGFGGVSTAFRLMENSPGSTVLLVEANAIGTGSSGRNAGFVSIAQIARAIVGKQEFTLDDQKMLLRLNKIAVDKILKIKSDNKLEFEWRQDGMYKAVREIGNQKKLELLSKYFDDLGVEYETVSSSDLSQRLGTDFYKKALYLNETYLNNPSEAIRGLATALPENVFVLENSPVLKVNGGSVPNITLSSGKTIKAKKIIMTISAFLKHFYQEKAGNVTAIHSFGALTRELTDRELESFRDVQPWGITGTHPSSATLRYTPTKRIFVRTDIAYAKNLNINPKRMYKALGLIKGAYDKRFVNLRHVEFEYIYGGLVSFTGNAQPFFGEVDQNVYAGVTSDGSGVTRASILGIYLADLVTGVESEELNYIKNNYRPNYLPPDPLRTIGAVGGIVLNNLVAGEEL